LGVGGGVGVKFRGRGRVSVSVSAGVRAAFTSASTTEDGVGLGGMARSLTGSAVGPHATTPWTDLVRVMVRVRVGLGLELG